MFSAGDRVWARTKLCRCQLLATVVATNPDKKNIRIELDYEVKGMKWLFVLASSLSLVDAEKTQQVENHRLKGYATNVLKKVKSK
jgi:hypothetical protein